MLNFSLLRTMEGLCHAFAKSHSFKLVNCAMCITCILSPSYLQCLLFEVRSSRDEMVIIQQEQIVHSSRSLSQLLPFIKQLRALVKHDLASDE